MRVVGEGHQFHRETGVCRRCGVLMNAEEALIPCPKARVDPPRRGKGKVPDLYELSRRELKE